MVSFTKIHNRLWIVLDKYVCRQVNCISECLIHETLDKYLRNDDMVVLLLLRDTSMGRYELGSQSSDSTKTPTLRQYYRAKEGKVPQQSFVSVVFKPGNYPNYSFVTEHNFRVSVSEDNPLHGVISEHLEVWPNDGVALFVEVKDGEKGSFSLVLSDDEHCTWEEFTWGWKCSKLVKTDPKSRKGRAKRNETDSPVTKP